MSEHSRSFLEKLVDLWRWLGQMLAPIRNLWATITAPVRQLFAPLTNWWRQFTAPVRDRWAAFKARNPRSGFVLGWMGTFFRWGFNFLLFLVLSVWVGLFGGLPSNDELRNIETANSTEIYTQDSVLIGKFFIENRTSISLDNVSPYIVNALIATEDRRFLEHSGIDFMSWLRVVKGVATRTENLGGGSTLSQQLAKNLYPRRNYHIPGVSLLINKIKENFISIRLEQIYDKQQLLNLYLNTVPFGGDAFGINVAARQYFNRKPKDLNVDQAATLVGMLKGTTLYNPVRNPENAKKRRNIVLRQMVKNGDLTEAEYETLSQKPVGAKRYNVDSNNDGLGTYFREYLRTSVMPDILENMKKEDGSNYNLYTDGLKIYTTINSRMQQYAEEAVQKQMSELQKKFNQHWKNYKQEKPWGDDKWIEDQVRRSQRWENMKDAGLSDEDARKTFEQPVKMTIFGWKNGGGDVDTTMTPIDSVRYYFLMLNCGFMAMDHHNGYVRAWVGGTNFKYFKFDHILSKRQVGSTFKPIVYSAAVQDSIRPCTYFANQVKKIVDWEPHNSDERYGGYYSMAGALTKSVNVVAAQLIEKVGIQKTIDLAQKMGVTAKLPREYGISLGACEVALFDMMRVYGTIANEGKRPEPITVLKVVDRDGEVVYDYKRELLLNPKLGPNVEALTPYQAGLMTEMLQNVIDYGTGSRLRRGFGLTMDFAGKTGTTQNNSDGWFIGFNPVLVTGAWVGAPSPAVRFRSMDLGQGSAMALPIVAWFWHKLANDRKLGQLAQQKFPDPKPEVLGALGCHPWISIKPDSFNNLINTPDSLLRDSLVRLYTHGKKRSDSGESETPGGEEGAGDSENSPKDDNPEKKERKGLLKTIFPFRNKEKDDDSDKNKGKDKPQNEKDKKN
ncbi:MAG: transglycosylase domain-containing protein [Saprospiraceae bacterium]|nr:transglycosylase domain-containing protein [Saprospiraceae bacterium]